MGRYIRKNKIFIFNKNFLLKGNAKQLILIFLGSLFLVFFDSINIMYYNHVVNNLDSNTVESNMTLLKSMILLLVNYFIFYIYNYI